MGSWGGFDVPRPSQLAEKKLVVSVAKEPQSPQTSGRTIHWARLYDILMRAVRLDVEKSGRKLTVELAELKPNDRVLDVGCGTGSVAISAKLAGAGEVHGIDAAPQMIRLAKKKAERRRLEIDFRIACIEDLPYPNDTFDVVLSRLVMHHLPNELKQRALSETYRVLRPGGRCVIVDLEAPPSRMGRVIAPFFTHHSSDGFKLHELPDMMLTAGFDGIEIGRTGLWFLGYVRGEKTASMGD